MSVEALKKIWPEWQIEEKTLEKGSFGVVYKAVRRDHNVESYAAIKVISVPDNPSEIDSLRSEGRDQHETRTYFQGVVDDFVSEIQMMESLKSAPNIVIIQDYKVVEKTDEIGWDIYIRMELLTSFNAYISDKKLTEEDVIKLGCDICRALETCAMRNIIHRAIKPENILVNAFGDFKLGDFGIARKMGNMADGFSQKGTINYMAPEVVSGREYDARADIYSLGIVLYRLLNANRLPFLDPQKQFFNHNDRKNAIDRRIRGERLPAPCEASPEMADLILRACAYDADRRFASATEMKEALMSVANGKYKKGGSNTDEPSPVNKTEDNPSAIDSVNDRPSVALQENGQAGGNPADTISVKNRLPVAPKEYGRTEVKSFGSVPKKQKKKNITPWVIAAIVLVIAFLAGVCVRLPRMVGQNG